MEFATGGHVSEQGELSQQVLDRLARAEGQIRGIRKMIEGDRDCEAILTQLLAARTALERAAEQIVGGYIDECLLDASPEEARVKISRAVKLLARIG